MADTRSGADEIRAGLAQRIRTMFDFRQVNGLTENPTVTQNPTRFTTEPYIYVYTVGQNEIDTTKDDTPYEYGINVEVVLRYNSYRGGQRQGDQILDEVVEILRGKNANDFPDLASVGYNIYTITTGDILNFTFKERGANYYKVICPFFVRAAFSELPMDVQPVQLPQFTYSGFTFTPQADRNIERWDTGNIIPATTYPSGNNGWDFTTATYQLSAGADGTYDGTNYIVATGDETLGIDSTINYEFNTDTSSTTSLAASTTWNRIDSLRFGSIDADGGNQPTFVDDDSATYGLRRLSNWNIDFGNVTPHNSVATITGNAGQYEYIIVDSGVTLAQINDNLGLNNVANFDVRVVGNYRIYVSIDPIYYDNSTFTYTLNVN